VETRKAHEDKIKLLEDDYNIVVHYVKWVFFHGLVLDRSCLTLPTESGKIVSLRMREVNKCKQTNTMLHEQLEKLLQREERL